MESHSLNEANAYSFLMASASLTGQVLAGRYEIRERLGQGGAAEVYKAYDQNLRRIVAIKLILPHLARDEGFRARFAREAQAVAQLRHPNIVQLYDFNMAGDLAFMVMEYLPGPTLHKRLQDLAQHGKRLPLAEAIGIFNATAAALQFAHAHGVIHRDVKPGNVIFDERGQPVLTDFGLAKILGGETFTPSGALMGTAPYMSPEQGRGIGGDVRSDIYSLGVLLFEMTTGQPPFRGDTPTVAILKHITDTPPSPRSINPDLPEALSQTILTAMAKDLAARYPSVEAFAADVQAALTIAPKTSSASRDDSAATIVVDMPPPAAGPAFDTPIAKPAVPVTSSVAAPVPAPRPSERGWLTPLLFIGAGLAGLAILAIGIGVGAVLLRPTATTEALPSGEGMVRISGGAFTLGTAETPDANHVAARQAQLATFWIDRYEVTNAQYAAFLQQTNGQLPYGWKANGTFPRREEQHPVRGVTFDQATTYCAARGKRLPSEAEWEAAARGTDGRLYPWGDDPNAVPLAPANTYPVGSVAANQSPFGVYDMAGNVWEWVRDPYEPVPSGRQVLRGGAYNYSQDMTYRLVGDPNVPTMIVDAGFRCAAEKVKGE